MDPQKIRFDQGRLALAFLQSPSATLYFLRIENKDYVIGRKSIMAKDATIVGDEVVFPVSEIGFNHDVVKDMSLVKAGKFKAVVTVYGGTNIIVELTHEFDLSDTELKKLCESWSKQEKPALLLPPIPPQPATPPQPQVDGARPAEQAPPASATESRVAESAPTIRQRARGIPRWLLDPIRYLAFIGAVLGGVYLFLYRDELFCGNKKSAATSPANALVSKEPAKVVRPEDMKAALPKVVPPLPCAAITNDNTTNITASASTKDGTVTTSVRSNAVVATNDGTMRASVPAMSSQPIIVIGGDNNGDINVGSAVVYAERPKKLATKKPAQEETTVYVPTPERVPMRLPEPNPVTGYSDTEVCIPAGYYQTYVPPHGCSLYAYPYEQNVIQVFYDGRPATSYMQHVYVSQSYGYFNNAPHPVRMIMRVTRQPSQGWHQ